ncbi:MAG: site-2 protease family protein [Bacilli bacterium]|nr:site-2 protease family protein [Bacilli bacterium]
MAWWQILVGIILFIVALGVLIGIHELGHLSAAKMFHVYCFNYSIGFGPKLISSKRTKKHETIWTLRAIPLGGFVSMYGEGAELDSDEYIPPSRSLEGIARYKRTIIISAGVFLNFILGFVLIFIHNAAFDQKQINLYRSSNNFSYFIQATVNKDLYPDMKNGDGIALELEPLQTVSVKNQKIPFYIIDDDVTIEGIESAKYVLGVTGIIPELNDDPDLNLSLTLYESRPYTSIEYSDDKLCTIWMRDDGVEFNKENIEYYNNIIKSKTEDDKHNIYDEKMKSYYEDKMHVNYTIIPDKPYNLSDKTPENINVDINYFEMLDGGYSPVKKAQPVTLKLNQSKNGWEKVGIAYKRYIWHYDAGGAFKASWDEWCNANTAVFRGLGTLITGQGEAMGLIGIADASITTLNNFGFGQYLSMWGLISCNLAILNLLPFPGLDGWQLVVIGYEAITRKQIPTKVKGIISAIGLGLLFLLMIFIIIKDIIRLI